MTTSVPKAYSRAGDEYDLTGKITHRLERGQRGLFKRTSDKWILQVQYRYKVYPSIYALLERNDNYQLSAAYRDATIEDMTKLCSMGVLGTDNG